jgi:hypothetical protein
MSVSSFDELTVTGIDPETLRHSVSADAGFDFRGPWEERGRGQGRDSRCRGGLLAPAVREESHQRGSEKG